MTILTTQNSKQDDLTQDETWIDVHTHLNMLEDSPLLALQEARAAGVKKILTIGTQPQDWPVVQELATTYFPEVAGAIGLHPHEASLWSSDLLEQMTKAIGHSSIVAVGEIGLDYHYNNSPRSVQLTAFREQLALAAQTQLPVEIHTREAEEDTIMVLREFKGQVTGLLHCFTSSWKLASEALDLGYHISFSGVITFKNAQPLREVCRQTPLDRLHVETDAPFLAPHPCRGQKNKPALIIHTATQVAQIKNITLSELSLATQKNAARLFPRWV